MEEQNNNGQLQIELREEVAQGTYANLAIITHSSSEFILDFVRVMPGIPKAGVQSRIIVAPCPTCRSLAFSKSRPISRTNTTASISTPTPSMTAPSLWGPRIGSLAFYFCILCLGSPKVHSVGL